MKYLYLLLLSTLLYQCQTPSVDYYEMLQGDWIDTSEQDFTSSFSFKDSLCSPFIHYVPYAPFSIKDDSIEVFHVWRRGNDTTILDIPVLRISDSTLSLEIFGDTVNFIKTYPTSALKFSQLGFYYKDDYDGRIYLEIDSMGNLSYTGKGNWGNIIIKRGAYRGKISQELRDEINQRIQAIPESSLDSNYQNWDVSHSYNYGIKLETHEKNYESHIRGYKGQPDEFFFLFMILKDLPHRIDLVEDTSIYDFYDSLQFSAFKVHSFIPPRPPIE